LTGRKRHRGAQEWQPGERRDLKKKKRWGIKGKGKEKEGEKSKALRGKEKVPPKAIKGGKYFTTPRLKFVQTTAPRDREKKREKERKALKNQT